MAMDDVFRRLDYNHDELDAMLYRLYKGHVLTSEEYAKLRELGVENLSTFSGDYNDLKNKPDFVIELQKAIDFSDIETKGSIDEKLKQLTSNFTNCYMDLNNNIRTDIALMESEIMELIELIAPGSSTLTYRMNQLEEKHAEDFQRLLALVEEMPTYASPTLSLSISPNKVVHGETTQITITPKFTQNDGGHVISYKLKSGDDILVESSDSVQPFTTTVSARHNTSFTFTVEVFYDDGPIKNTNAGTPYPETSIKAGSLTASASVKGYAYSYYGAIDSGEITKDEIAKLSKTLLTSKGNTAFYNLKEGQRSVFMYPSTFGQLSSIKDANNFDYIDSYNFTTYALDEVVYNVYILKDPVEIDNFKQVFN